MRIFLNLITILFLFSCSVEEIDKNDVVYTKKVKQHLVTHEEEGKSEELNQEGIDYRKLAFEAVETGDTEKYDKASDWYFRGRSPENFLFFANLMARKYNYSRAYYDVYSVYNHFYKVFDETDTLMFNTVYYNLAKAHELGHNIRYEKVLGKEVTNENIGNSNDYIN